MWVAEECGAGVTAVGQHATPKVQQVAGHGQMTVDVYMRAVNGGNHPVGGRVGRRVGA